MPGIYRLLRCVGSAVITKGPKALLGIIPFGEAIFEIASDAFAKLKEEPEQQIRDEITEVAKVDGVTVRQHAEAVVKEVAGDRPLEEQLNLVTYLTLIPNAFRRSLSRPSDPTGTTVPPAMTLQTPQSLMAMLPSRLPRFKPGDRPTPGGMWRLVELLGVGGFGEVWKAENPVLKAIPPVALKFCLDPKAVATLKYEGAVLDRIMQHGNNPGIVPLKGANLEAEPCYLEYEYIDGGNLSSYIKDRPVQQEDIPAWAAKIMRNLAKTVGGFHRLSPPVVHRDLKPANILLQSVLVGGRKGIRLRIADFGIGGVATQALQGKEGGSTSKGELAMTSLRGSHTRLYASPQQIDGNDPDPQDDVHALGVIWYQLLTGDLTKGAPQGKGWRSNLQQQGVGTEFLDLMEECFDGELQHRIANAAILAERIEKLIQKKLMVTAAISSSQNPAVYGQAVTLTARVNAVPPASNIPTGTVEFMEGQEVLASVPLNAGVATFTTSALTVGSHSIAASYGGDTNYSAGTSPLLSQNVTQAPLTIIASDANKVSGEDDPAFTISYAGFVNGETVSVLEGVLIFTTPATDDSPPGTYPLTPSGVTSRNYNIKFVSATLTVTQADPPRIDPLKEGRTCLEAKDYSEAIKLFTQALKANPDAAGEVYRLRARAYVGKGKIDKALGDLDALVKRERQNADNFVQRGKVLLMNEKPDRAINDFSQAILLGNRSAAVLLERGRAYAAKGLLDLAYADLDAALRTDPEAIDVYLQRGEMRLGQGLLDQALADFAEAIRRRPEDFRCLIARGRVLFKQGKIDEALNDFMQAVQRHPQSADAYINRAKVWMHRGGNEQALADLNQGLQFDPMSVEGLVARGQVRTRLGQYNWAISDFTKATALRPRDAVLRLERGRAYQAKGDFEAAADDYQAAIKIDQDYADAFLARGEVYLASGSYGRAINDFTKVLELVPARPAALLGRAWAYLEKRQADKALADASEVIRQGHDLADAYHARGCANLALDVFDQAVADLSESLRLKPENAACLNDRGRTHHLAGNYDQAVADCTAAIKLNNKVAEYFLTRAKAYNKKGQRDKALADQSRAESLKPATPTPVRTEPEPETETELPLAPPEDVVPDEHPQ